MMLAIEMLINFLMDITSIAFLLRQKVTLLKVHYFSVIAGRAKCNTRAETPRQIAKSMTIALGI
jgi:hypothetical protein